MAQGYAFRGCLGGFDSWLLLVWVWGLASLGVVCAWLRVDFFRVSSGLVQSFAYLGFAWAFSAFVFAFFQGLTCLGGFSWACLGLGFFRL